MRLTDVTFWSQERHVWFFTGTFHKGLGDILYVLAWAQIHAESSLPDIASSERQYKKNFSICCFKDVKKK